RGMCFFPDLRSTVRRRPKGGARLGKNGVSKGERNRRFRSLWVLLATTNIQSDDQSSHSPFSVCFVFLAERRTLSRPRQLLARRREVLTGFSSPLIIAKAGNGSGPRRSRAVSGSCWPSLLMVSTCLARPLASRPASIRTRFGPVGPLLDGVPRFGGALLSRRRSQWTKTPNAVCPIATVMLYFDASQCPPSPFRDFLNLKTVFPFIPSMRTPPLSREMCSFPTDAQQFAADQREAHARKEW